LYYGHETDRQAGTQTERHTDRNTNKQIHRQTKETEMVRIEGSANGIIQIGHKIDYKCFRCHGNWQMSPSITI